MTEKLTVAGQEIELITELKMRHYHAIEKLSKENSGDNIEITMQCFVTLCESIGGLKVSDQEKREFIDNVNKEDFEIIATKINSIFEKEKESEKKKIK